jgi:hypothetical protein
LTWLVFFPEPHNVAVYRKMNHIVELSRQPIRDWMALSAELLDRFYEAMHLRSSVRTPSILRQSTLAHQPVDTA